ncbi:Transcription factor Dp-2 [Mortierella sp. AD094]|nr:Transcription factor Dp-2 [Mortierella sp. AD094]
MMHGPSHGGEHAFMLDHPLGQDNDLRPPQRIPPPIPRIRTKWSKDSTRECPPLSLQSSSSYSTSRSGDSKMSPSTPRSSVIVSSTLGESYSGYDLPKPVYNALVDHPSNMGHFVSESPVDYRNVRPYRDDHDMEHCSEQDDVREREHDDDEEDDEDEDENQRTRKVARHHIANDSKTNPVVNNAARLMNSIDHGTAVMRPADDDEEDTEEGNSTYASSSGSRKPSLTNSPLRDASKIPKKAARGKTTIPPLSAPVQAILFEAVACYEEEGQGQDETGAQSLNGKGLGYYAPLVCARVAARGVTTYNDLVNDLASSQPVERAEGGATQEKNGQGNIRRRVYDALNILEALGIIVMNKKAIRWIGIENARPIAELSRKILPQDPLLPTHGLQQQERDGADESEEPEDDEMDIGIEQLQKDVEAMRLRNELEMARLQDQVARGVRLNNLVERNKHKEEKEMERQMRRRQKKLERKEEKRAQAAAAGGDSMDVEEESGDAADGHKKRSEKRHHRHHRHRSPRPENEDQEDDDDDTNQDGAKPGDEVDEETARRIRKQERREKRERKERRAQKRLEKEAGRHNEERIPLPFVIVRIPGYAGQSSDSEASISVVRRVREESKKQTDETTMVDIKMPHNEELNIISDTEVIGDLGLNDVPLADLKALLPQEAFENAGYTTTTTTGEFGDNVIATVRGGFERALVCSVGN